MSFCVILFCGLRSRRLKITNSPLLFLILCHNFPFFLSSCTFCRHLIDEASHQWIWTGEVIQTNLNLVSGFFLVNWKMSHYWSLSKDSLCWITCYAVLSSKYSGNEDILRDENGFWLIKNRDGMWDSRSQCWTFSLRF